MRIELRVCKHCFEGEHGNEHKTAVTRDLVACARVVREYKDELDLDDVHLRMVTESEDDDGRPAAIPAVAATLQNEQITISDTQLVTMGENGYMLVYPNPQDALAVLSGNIDEISKVVEEDVTPELSAEGAEILADTGGGGGPSGAPGQSAEDAESGGQMAGGPAASPAQGPPAAGAGNGEPARSADGASALETEGLDTVEGPGTGEESDGAGPDQHAGSESERDSEEESDSMY